MMRLGSIAPDRDACSLILSHPLGAGIVFGLNWMPIMGGVPKELGRRRARLLRATHFLVIGESAAVVGCGAIKDTRRYEGKERLDRSGALFSAAAMFAAEHALGIVAGLFEIPNKGYWLIAVNAGLVLAQTDRLIVTLDEAQLAVTALENRFPSLRLLALQKIESEALPSWMVGDLKREGRLYRLSVSVSPFLTGIVALVFVGCLYGSWVFLHRPPVPIKPSAESADIRWAQVMSKFSSSHSIHDPDHLFEVLQSWQKAPLKPGGWQLRRIFCETASMDWHCAAHYQRIQRMARSEQLDAAKPEKWNLDLIDLDHAALRWEIRAAASTFQTVSSSTPFKIWMSYLQSVTPVFESIEIGSGTRITIQAPVDEYGVVIDRPAHIKSLKRRSLSIKGPLRSASALKGLTVPVRWRSVHLNVGSVAGVGITRSALLVHLIGEVYEVSE